MFGSLMVLWTLQSSVASTAQLWSSQQLFEEKMVVRIPIGALSSWRMFQNLDSLRTCLLLISLVSLTHSPHAVGTRGICVTPQLTTKTPGLPLGLQLQTASSGTQTVPGMPRDAVQQVCDRLRRFRGAAARDWADLCVFDANGDPIRVISPAVLLSQRPDTFPAFFRRYVDRVWAYYSTNTLTIDTQNANGKVGCRVVGDEMQCDGDNRGYAKPNAEDIFGCDRGPFSIQEGDGAVHRAVVPRLCAAFNRGTLLLDGGGVQPALPPASYYTARPHNLYSALVHAVELEGRGYAFSYDDVAPSPEENVAGTVAAADPQLLTVFVGGI